VPHIHILPPRPLGRGWREAPGEGYSNTKQSDGHAGHKKATPKSGFFTGWPMMKIFMHPRLFKASSIGKRSTPLSMIFALPHGSAW
jgi:hypothetical protein